MPPFYRFIIDVFSIIESIQKRITISYLIETE